MKNDDTFETQFLFGRNAVMEALKAQRPVNQILVSSTQGGLTAVLALAKERGIVIKQVDARKLDALANGANHQGICAECAPLAYVSVEEILGVSEKKGTNPFLILCDGVEDPHNLGAILRTAEAAGADGVILPKRRSASLTATVCKTSAGAANWIPVARVSNLATEMIALKKRGIWFLGAEANGTDAREANLSVPMGLVIGSEGFGLSAPVRAQCDGVLGLPMRGHVNSLNASVAAGILIYEILRQRGI